MVWIFNDLIYYFHDKDNYNNKEPICVHMLAIKEQIREIKVKKDMKEYASDQSRILVTDLS